MTICDDCKSVAPAYKPKIEEYSSTITAPVDYYFTLTFGKDKLTLRLSEYRDLCIDCMKGRAEKIFENGAILGGKK